jgi:NAD(P)H-hydrate epimerase
MVVDADALVALAARPEILSQPVGPRVLTPHPGEFVRLVGRTIPDAKNLAVGNDQERSAVAATLAQTDATGRTIVVLKGHRTVITDGKRAAANTTGNPGMATGGSGDVLTGVITALLCQSLEPFDSARLGVHLHGLAGDLAAEKLGQVSLIASDLIDFLSGTFQSASSLTPEP